VFSRTSNDSQKLGSRDNSTIECVSTASYDAQNFHTVCFESGSRCHPWDVFGWHLFLVHHFAENKRTHNAPQVAASKQLSISTSYDKKTRLMGQPSIQQSSISTSYDAKKFEAKKLPPMPPRTIRQQSMFQLAATLKMTTLHVSSWVAFIPGTSLVGIFSLSNILKREKEARNKPQVTSKQLGVSTSHHTKKSWLMGQFNSTIECFN
jgi:hypothetical protein